jgi:hypothetical protein
LCPVADDETVVALGCELVRYVVGLIYLGFGDSLYPTGGSAVDRVKDFPAPRVDGGDDEAVRETSGEGCQIEARDPNHGYLASVS